MSVEALALALHHSRAQGTVKVVLLGIANHEGDGGAWPSIATLTKYAGLTGKPDNNAKVVRRAIKTLVDLGEIEVERQGGGPREMKDYERPNLYRVTLRCPEGCDGTTKHKPRTPTSTPGLSSPPGGGQLAPREGAEQPPKPSLEPSAEPSYGSDDRNEGLPPGSNAPRPTAKQPQRKPTKLQQERMNADFLELIQLCEAEDVEDPYSVWWTLRLEHKATSPYRFMADLVDKGQWDGFVGRYGITTYERPEATG